MKEESIQERSNVNEQLEGNCRIESVELITFNYLKTLTIGLVICLTLAGAIILYHFKKLRACVFYSYVDSINKASHLYIKDSQGRQEISKINAIGNSRRQFDYKKLRYFINQDKHFEPALFSPFKAKIDLQTFLSTGLSSNQVSAKRQMYGENEHTVDTPNYFEYMFSVVFTPLYLVQYFVLLIVAAQGNPIMGIILVVLSYITTSGNYIALYFSNRKIKQIAEKIHKVKVVRNSRVSQIQSKELVPGDLLIVQNSEMSCDALLVKGEAYMNEQSLTGQTVPEGKVQIDITKNSTIKHQNILFEGTLNIEVSQNTFAIVVRTGFTTRKGSILRQMLNRVPKQPDFFIKGVYFLIFSGIISIVLFFATLVIKLNVDIDRSLIWLDIFNFIINAINPAFPIYFTMAYSWSIYRLKHQNILTTMPEKIVEGNRLKISCFDKTGTLTENNLIMNEVYLYDKKFKEYQYFQKDHQALKLMKILFGTCHTVRSVNNELFGDQVDIRMFEFSQFKKTHQDKQIYEDSQNKLSIEILKVNQFQSKFQSMTVLVQDRQSNKVYCLSKGAPEKLIAQSVVKPEEFDDFVSQLALKGLRTICFNYKEVSPEQVQHYKSCQRQNFLKDSKLLGLVTFQNQLKSDTAETIKNLKEADLDCKIITGDGIFIAVQTAYRAGILGPNEEVLLIQGKKQGTKKTKVKGILLTKTNQGYSKKQIKMNVKQISTSQNRSIAIDNDYLNTNPPQEVFLSTKIFARTVPQNKAKIISRLKQTLTNHHQKQPYRKRLFGQGHLKISMTGDGANDLLAIQQADVGIAIGNKDASYGAAFTVQQLSQVIEVFKEGKCTTQAIVENCRYFLIVSYMSIIVDVLCSTEATLMGAEESLFMNFSMITPLPIIAAFSKPNSDKKLSRHYVQDNFVGLENQLLTWGNIIIIYLGVICGFFYIRNHPHYIPNPKPYHRLIEGYNAQCQLVTAIFLMLSVPIAASAILIYKSDPWKNPIYRNVVLMVWLAVDFIIIIVLFIMNEQMAGFLQTVALPEPISCLYLFLISVASLVVAFLFNNITLKILHPQYEEKQAKIAQKIETTQTTIHQDLIN